MDGAFPLAGVDGNGNPPAPNDIECQFTDAESGAVGAPQGATLGFDFFGGSNPCRLILED